MRHTETGKGKWGDRKKDAQTWGDALCLSIGLSMCVPVTSPLCIDRGSFHPGVGSLHILPAIACLQVTHRPMNHRRPQGT